MIEIETGDRVLHLGFGDGAATRDFASRASLVLGVDPSGETVRLARRLAMEIENLMFVTGSPEQVPWQESFFTVVVSEAPPDDWPRAVREIFRVTAPGGRVWIASPPDGAEALFLEAGFAAVTLHAGPSRLEALKSPS